jgi:arylsulfatase
VHEGGISTPFILHWPGVIPAGGKLRHAPGHIIDFVPTVMELAGVSSPASWSGQTRPALPGKSLVTLLKRDAALPRDALYWHHEGNRAVRMGDWKLVSEFENAGQWELYNLKRDRIESKNLAASHPERVRQMSAVWQQMDEEFRQPAGPAKVDK